MNFTVSLAKRLALLCCIFLICYVITSVVAGIVVYKFPDSTRWLRIATILQDIILFILPAIATAMLVTRLPATFLAIDRRPTGPMTFWAVAALVTAMPAMEAVTALNESLKLPASMSAVEEVLRTAELSARQSIGVVLGVHSVGSLIVSLLIISVLAGFSEELFFRGTLQRMLTTGRVNVHLAIWLTAVVFSGFHMQIYGFVPRMLLGALFGYSLLWSRSLWLPVLLHIINNGTYLVVAYCTPGQWPVPENDTAATEIFHGSGIAIVCISVVLTAMCLFMMHRKRVRADIIRR